MAAVVPDPPEIGDYVLCARDGFLQWTPIEQFRGERGFSGPRGERGPAGPAGRPGRDAPLVQITMPRQAIEGSASGTTLAGHEDGTLHEWE